MWPFKKKQKVTTLTGDDATAFMKSLSFARAQQVASSCPPELANSKLCVCMDCPKRGECWTERWNHQVMNCSWFNRACSYKAQLLGKLSGYEKFILDPYFIEKYGKLFTPGLTKEKSNAEEKDQICSGNASGGDCSRRTEEVSK